MADAIIGVIVGGFIASIAPLGMLYFNHLHWKRDAKLNYLTAERVRLETLSEKTLTRLTKAMTENAYPSDMTADIMTFMPEEVITRFDIFMCDPDITEKKCKVAYLELAREMKKMLANIDEQISDLLK
jgi:hypothetical protein